ncbi:hypothetical protein GE061_004997 [Apolygus lucorum]|uniref:Uncharacterized protein n=1 Tax=Apolygus lucorum TaxID=248454 RepID=A0A8S9WWE4_APOLU|nr:hypothetical protein GE061_004997 [Apolygus lucorum]
MGDEKREGDNKSVKEEQKSDEGTKQMDEMGEKEKVTDDMVDEEQQRRELELLHEQKEKLKEEFEKDDQRLTILTQEKENIERMASEARETTDELLKSYEKQEYLQQNIVEDQSARSFLKEDISGKIETMKVSQGENTPELEVLQAKLKKLEEEDKRDEERNNEINAKKIELEKLLMDHAVSISEIETRRKAIDEELHKISTRMTTRELEEQKILERIAAIKTAISEQTIGSQKSVPKEGVIISYQSIQSSSSFAQLIEQKQKAVNVSKAIRELKEDISDMLKRDHLTEEDIKGLPKKQNVIMFRLAELDQITRRIQELMGLTETASLELSVRSKLNLQSDSARQGIGTLSQIHPEDTLPQVVVCGTYGNYPQIVVCEAPTFRNPRERIVHNGNSNAGPTPSQQQTTYPGVRADFFNFAKLGDGQPLETRVPYYGAGMEALGMMGPFGQSNMPIAGWMIAPGFGYTIRPPVPVQGPMIMPQQMFHPGMFQSASVGSIIPCPCIYPKKRRKRHTVIPQVYSCPNVKRQSLRCNRPQPDFSFQAKPDRIPFGEGGWGEYCFKAVPKAAFHLLPSRVLFRMLEMSDLEGKKKKFDEEIEIDKSLTAGNLSKTQYDLQKQEKTKEKEEIVQKQFSQERTDSHKSNEEVSLASEKEQVAHSAGMEMIDPKLEVPLQKERSKSSPSKEMGKSPKRRSAPNRFQEERRRPLEYEGENVMEELDKSEEPTKKESKEEVKKQAIESEKVSKEPGGSKSALSQKEADKAQSIDKLPLRVEIKEPPSDKGSEQLEAVSSNQLQGKSKGRRGSSLKDIGRTLRRASVKERRISTKEASERGIVPPKADGTSEPTPSNEQSAEPRNDPILEEAKGISKSPPLGQESEQPTVSHDRDIEVEDKRENYGSEEPTTMTHEPDVEMTKTKDFIPSSPSTDEDYIKQPLNDLSKEDEDPKQETKGKLSIGSAKSTFPNNIDVKPDESKAKSGEKTDNQDKKTEEDSAKKDSEEIRRKVQMKKTLEEQRTALATKLQEIQVELHKLESDWKDMGFFGPMVSAVAALKKQARDREMDESGGRRKRRLELRLKELENENARRIRRLDRIQSQMNELDYSLKEKIIDEAEYKKGKEILYSEKATVDEEGRAAEEEMHKTIKQIKLADKIGSEKRSSTDPETELMETKLQLEKQVEELNDEISAKKRKIEEDEGREPVKMREGGKDEAKDGASQPPAANVPDNLDSQAEKERANEEVKTLEQLRDKVENDLVGINGILERIKGPRQQMMLWGAVAAVAMIYLHEFSKTFMVVH